MTAMIDRLLIWVSALIFAAFGTWIFVMPEALEMVGITLTSGEARTDIRATYGGLQWGIAAFLIIVQSRPEWYRAGLLMALCGAAGLSAGRLVGMLVDGGATPLMQVFFAVEALGVVVLTVALRRNHAQA